MKHIVLFSGGIGSWACAKRVIEKNEREDVILLFADTKSEDEDLYRFLSDASVNIGVPITSISDGRDVWEVFRDVKFLGNSRIDPCSRILKRELCNKWIADRYTPDNCIRHIGYDCTESNRWERYAARMTPWKTGCPLSNPPYLFKADLLQWAKCEGLKPARLYGLGFSHNNCGGFCVKAGKSHFKRLLEVFPKRFSYHERKEQELREYLQKDVSILPGQTLREFRQEIEAGAEPSLFDWGGCGCFAGSEDAETN